MSVSETMPDHVCQEQRGRGMRLPVMDRTTIPYMTEREIPAIKAALSAWRKLRRDRNVTKHIRDLAATVPLPLRPTDEDFHGTAFNLELFSQIEERIRKEAKRHD